MHINKIQLTSFKRFSKLTIDLSAIQPAPKLVLLIGVNGSGKSSIFDAFEWISQPYKDESYRNWSTSDYHNKNDDSAYVRVDFDNQDYLEAMAKTAITIKNRKDFFYGRSAVSYTHLTLPTKRIV